jgi:hypothetical protein
MNDRPLQSIVELRKDNMRLIDQLQNCEGINEDLRRKIGYLQERMDIVQTRWDETLSKIECLTQENRVLTVKLSEQIEITERLRVERSKMDKEVEDLSRSLFEETNSVIAREVEQKQYLEKKCVRMELQLNSQTELLQQQTLQLKNLRDKTRNYRINTYNISGIYSRGSIWNKMAVRLNQMRTFDYELLDEINSAWISDQMVTPDYEKFKNWLSRVMGSAEELEKDPFVKTLLEMDVGPVLDSLELGDDMRSNLVNSIISGKLSIETISINMRSRCCFCKRLTRRPLATTEESYTEEEYCLYLGTESEVRCFNIDAICRNKLVPVCDLFGFINCLQLGLYSTFTDSKLYFQFLNIKRNIFYARTNPIWFFLNDLNHILSFTESTKPVSNTIPVDTEITLIPEI